MGITGIHSITYTTRDVAQGARFHELLGLRLARQSASAADFELPDGTAVLLRSPTEAAASGPFVGPEGGVSEVCWAVDSEPALAALARGLATDRAVQSHGSTECSFVDDAGLSVRLRVAAFKPLEAQADPVNAPGRVERLNQLRPWYERATPQQFQHVVFAAPEPRAAARFYVQRLGFRISDIQEEGGVFLRAPGNIQHHNLYWQRGEARAFRHIAYGVRNVDEIMAGAGFMARHGFASRIGLGRHRISSTFFYYMPNPCGGESEYATDADCLDDNWQPRVWGRAFGHIWWLAQGREHEPAARVRLADPDDLRLD